MLIIAPTAPTANILAELAMAVSIDPLLAARYAADPRAVLAEHGVRLTAGESAPVLIAADELELDDLAAISDGGHAAFTYTWTVEPAAA